MCVCVCVWEGGGEGFKNCFNTAWPSVGFDPLTLAPESDALTNRPPRS